MLDKRIETPGFAMIIKTSNLKQEKTQHFNLRLYKLVSAQEEQKPRSSSKETCLRQIQAFMLLLFHLKKGKKETYHASTQTIRKSECKILLQNWLLLVLCLFLQKNPTVKFYLFIPL